MNESPRPMPPKVSERLFALAQALRGREVTLDELAHVGDESEDAYFLLALLFSLPFCQPVPLLGLSTPFGLMLIAIGWAMLLGKPFRVPARLAAVKLPHTFVPTLLLGAGRMVRWLESHLKPRRQAWARLPELRRVHGALILFWALMLALPLPIPLSNVFSALPIALISAALLEDDGVMVVRAYLCSAICGAYWLTVIFFGHEITRHAGLLWRQIGEQWGL